MYYENNLFFTSQNIHDWCHYLTISNCAINQFAGH